MRSPERILTIFILNFVTALFIEIDFFCFFPFLNTKLENAYHQALAGHWRQKGDTNNNNNGWKCWNSNQCDKSTNNNKKCYDLKRKSNMDYESNHLNFIKRKQTKKKLKESKQQTFSMIEYYVQCVQCAHSTQSSSI